MPTNASTKVIFHFESTKKDKDKKTTGVRRRGNVRQAKQFKSQAISGGTFNFSPEEVAVMQSSGTLASDYRRGDINPAILAAAHGIDIASYMKGVETLKTQGNASAEVIASLENSVDSLQNIYVGDVDLYVGLRSINQENRLTGIEIVTGDSNISSQPGQIVFEHSLEDGFRPVANIARPLIGKVKGKFQKKVGDWMKKGAKKLAKKAGLKAAEKITGETVDKGVNAAVTAAVAATGIGAPISEAVGWIAGKISKFLYEKVLSKIVDFIKNHKEDIAALGLGLAGLGLLGSSPFIILGGVGLAAVGGLAGGLGVLGTAIAAAWAALSALLLASIGPVVITILISIIVIPLFVAFVIFIITTGAYIVPGSPGTASYTCVSQLQGLGIFTNGEGRADEYVSFVNPSVVVHLDNFNFASQTGSGTLDVGRSWVQFRDDEFMDFSRDEIVSRLTTLMNSHSDIDVWQAYNEPLAHGAEWDWLIEMDTAVIETGAQNHKNVCIGNFKEGWPSDDDIADGTFANYASDIMEVVNSEDVQNSNIQVYLCVHEHETVEHWEFNERYNGRFTQLVANGLELPVIVTVAGFDSLAGPDADHGVGWQGIIEPADYVDMLLEYQSAARAAGAVGVAVFQLGLSGDWDSYDLSPLLDLAVDCRLSSQIPVNSVRSVYMDVTKTAREVGTGSSGPFNNSDLSSSDPLEIQYTVTLRARNQVISNIRISDSCSAIQTDRNNPCPDPSTAIENPDSGFTLGPGETYQLTYTRSYSGDQYEDSWIGDLVTVVFNTPTNLNEEAYGSASIQVGTAPNICPSGWPLPTPDNPDDYYWLTQGAYTNFSHEGWEAIDIARTGIIGIPVYATHAGVVEIMPYETNGFGNHLKIHSTCEARSFYSLYAHLHTITAQPGPIEKGEQIGTVGGSGGFDPHLHYEFKYSPNNPCGGPGDTYVGRPPYMMPSEEGTYATGFYVPKDLPRGCVVWNVCNTRIP